MLDSFFQPRFAGRRQVVHALCCVVASGWLAGCQPTTGGDRPVTSARLRGTHLVDIKRDASWTFGDAAVVIENDGQPLPEDLVEELLSDGSAPQRIAASWQFDQPAGVLRLSELQVDGQAVAGEIQLPIRPAGHVRVNLGARQYNLLQGDRQGP